MYDSLWKHFPSYHQGRSACQNDHGQRAITSRARQPGSLYWFNDPRRTKMGPPGFFLFLHRANRHCAGHGKQQRVHHQQSCGCQCHTPYCVIGRRSCEDRWKRRGGGNGESPRMQAKSFTSAIKIRRQASAVIWIRRINMMPFNSCARRQTVKKMLRKEHSS